MTVGLIGFTVLCFGSLIWGNFHIRLVYPLFGLNKKGTGNKRILFYKKRFNFCQRFFLLFLLSKDNRHSIWFRIYFVLHYIEWILAILVVTKVYFDDYNFFRLIFFAFGILTMITISIALEIPHMD
jgi:hypothetical protein